MHIGSYKSLSFFPSQQYWMVLHIYWISKSFGIGWDDVWSRKCFPPCSFRSRAAEIMVTRLCDNFRVSRLVEIFLTVQEPELTAKMLRKSLFQDRWLKDIVYQEWVLKDKLDKHYAQCMACKIQLILFVCSLLLWRSLKNLISVLTSPYKYVVIWL